MRSSLGRSADEIQAVKHAVRDENLKSRVVTVEKNMYLLRPIEKIEQPRQEDPVKTEKKKVLLRQSKEMLHTAKRKLEDCERDINIMKAKKKPAQQISRT